MVCQKTLFGEKQLEFNRRPNSFHDFSLDIFAAEVAAFRASVYRDCKSDEDLFCSKALKLNAFFFAPITSFIFWFHQGVLFSLYRPPLWAVFALSAADEMIADLNRSHSFLMSSDTSGSCLNLDDILDANWSLTSLSSKAFHLIPVSHNRPVGFLFGQGFESRKEHTTTYWSVDNSAPRFTWTFSTSETKCDELRQNLSKIFDLY